MRTASCFAAAAVCAAGVFSCPPAYAHLTDGSPAVTVPARPAAPVAPAVWIVAPGDTLSAISVDWGRTVGAVASWNHVADPDLIAVGAALTAPPASWSPPAAVEPVRAVTPRRAASVAVGAHWGASGGTPAAGGVWACIAQHESGGNPTTNTGNGYYGLYQDTPGSWAAAGGPPGLPSAYPASVQTAVNARIQQQQGWGAWPVSSRACGA